MLSRRSWTMLTHGPSPMGHHPWATTYWSWPMGHHSWDITRRPSFVNLSYLDLLINHKLIVLCRVVFATLIIKRIISYYLTTPLYVYSRPDRGTACCWSITDRPFSAEVILSLDWMREPGPNNGPPVHPNQPISNQCWSRRPRQSGAFSVYQRTTERLCLSYAVRGSI